MLSLVSCDRAMYETMVVDAEMLRMVASHNLNRHRQQKLGQFLTPLPVAELMVRMFQKLDLPHIRLLDAGAGTGCLSAAFVAYICQQQKRPDFLEVVAYEIDPILIEYLQKTLEMCNQECRTKGINFKYFIHQADFIKEAASFLTPSLFNKNSRLFFTHTILNPPYFKINARSDVRGFLRSMVFDSRQKAFNDDVLQETVIIHALKDRQKSSEVAINTSICADDDLFMSNTLPYTEVVRPDDPDQFIRIIPDALSEKVIEQMANFTCSLNDLELKVSTGRVVDFRAREYLRLFPEDGTVPLIYPVNFNNGYIEHPKSTKKPQALVHVDETAALELLKQLGFPRAQLNERSALTLLALVDLKPGESWQSSSSPLMGITPMMNFMAEHYGKTYKPNTRETVRRQTIHQFLDAALIVANPDNLERPINSPKTVYQIEESALELLRTYNTPEWVKNIRTYLASVQTLKERYAQERSMSRIPVVIEGELKALSPGGQNILVEKIINEFAPRFTPGGKLLYVGDTDDKFPHFNQEELFHLVVNVNSHGKMPDVIIHFTQNNWLVLIEAVTSHGPIDPKRKNELEKLFSGSQIPLVMVTTFLSRKPMVEYLTDIAWETDVWVAEDPTHLIHFNGQHLLQLHQQGIVE